MMLTVVGAILSGVPPNVKIQKQGGGVGLRRPSVLKTRPYPNPGDVLQLQSAEWVILQCKC